MSQDKSEKTQEGILIVDDEPGHLSMMRVMLESAGYEIYAAPNGDVAIRIATRRIPDLILLDVKLGPGGKEGFEVCRKLKEDPATSSIPIIFITGLGERENIIEGLRTGGIDYIVKPSSEEEVLARIQNHLKTQRLTRELKQKNIDLQEEIKKREESEEARRTAEEARRKAHEQLLAISEKEAKHWGIEGLVGKSPAFVETLKTIGYLKGNSTNVLITGENGTGKGVIAKAIHQISPSAKGPFIQVLCPNINKELAESELFGHVRGSFTGADRDREGAFDKADGGTIFLDEIGAISLDMQTKLLGVLGTGSFTPVGGREKHVDVRVLAATNADLRAMIRQGTFREDLYFRLRKYPVVVPPLRDRKEDIPLLALHFIKMEDKEGEVSIGQEALDLLISYSYPGNVRELQNIIGHALIVCDGPEILPEHLNFTLLDEETDSGGKNQFVDELTKEILSSETTGYRKATRQFQSNLVEHVLKECNWNRHEAAKLLDMDRSNLVKLIKDRKIKEPELDT